MSLIHVEILKFIPQALPEMSLSLQSKVQVLPLVKDALVHTLKVRISAQKRISLALWEELVPLPALG